MEDLAASLMSHSHSAPLYLLYDVSSLTKHGLAPPPVHEDDFDGDDGFEFATAAKYGCGDAALRACASDVSSAAFADELFRAGALLPLRLPPRLQRPARSAGASAATSPTSSGCRTKHRGFDPFAAALEKVRKDGDGAAAPRRSRSFSPPMLRSSAASAHNKKDSNSLAPRPAAAAQKVGVAVAARPTWRAKKGVKHLLSRAVMASAAAAPRPLRPRKKDGVSYKPGLLVCFGF
ncbi:hypothetical protein EJB05_51260, partial [Eragrostis curvula]